MEPVVESAKKFAKSCYEKEGRDFPLDYFLKVETEADFLCKKLSSYSIDTKKVMTLVWLHTLLSKTNCQEEDIIEHFGDDVYTILYFRLFHHPEMEYDNYICEIVDYGCIESKIVTLSMLNVTQNWTYRDRYKKSCIKRGIIELNRNLFRDIA